MVTEFQQPHHSNKIAVIIGAGPAGLTAAYELATKTSIKPIVIEKSDHVGGISRTVKYKGNRIDIGGHRFFSKSDKVMDWWQNVFPVCVPQNPDRDRIDLPLKNTEYQNTDKVFLLRKRISRLYYKRKLFDYPISLGIKTLSDLGLPKSIKIGFGYVYTKIFPRKPEESLEDFYINKFGTELYKTFFESYSEKLWGIPPSKMSADWGAQRVKGVDLRKVIATALKRLFVQDKSVEQKSQETSLIQQFLYPKYGPGQLWEEVANKITHAGGEVRLHQKVIGLNSQEKKITEVTVKTNRGVEYKIEADFVFSTMPLPELINGLNPRPPDNILKIVNELKFRDFITVGILLDKLKIKNQSSIKTRNDIIPDNWIYVHEPDVKVLRVQFFNNWSPYMVSDLSKVWLGMEYTTTENEGLWKKSNEEVAIFAVEELEKIGIADKRDVLDTIVIKMEKTYPVYVGAYNQLDTVREFTDKIGNLYLIGRNGMYRYNNMDHSMLTAMQAVENVISGNNDKRNIWNINVEKKYHEKKR